MITPDRVCRMAGFRQRTQQKSATAAMTTWSQVSAGYSKSVRGLRVTLIGKRRVISKRRCWHLILPEHFTAKWRRSISVLQPSWLGPAKPAPHGPTRCDFIQRQVHSPSKRMSRMLRSFAFNLDLLSRTRRESRKQRDSEMCLPRKPTTRWQFSVAMRRRTSGKRHSTRRPRNPRERAWHS